jgi:hypothetical protein
MTEPVKRIDCRGCKHYRATAVFELCMRTEALYKIADKIGQHTIGHMRRVHLCGEDGKLFEPRALTSSAAVGD